MSENAKPGLSNLTLRLLTAAVVVPIIFALLLAAPWWGFLILVYLATTVAAAELASMTLGPHRPQQAWAVAASLATLTLLYFGHGEHVLTSLVVILVVSGFLVGLTRPLPIQSAGGRLAWLVVIPLYTGGLLWTMAALHRLEHGGFWVLLTMMLAWLGDTGGYFAGRAFGRHKLYPTVSPKKTVEGAVGSLAGSVGGALFAHFVMLPELSLTGAIALGLVGGVVGQAGDLSVSLVKRSAGVKDSGFIVPGHGGLLDRIDALLLTSASTWLYATWFLP